MNINIFKKNYNSHYDEFEKIKDQITIDGLMKCEEKELNEIEKIAKDYGLIDILNKIEDSKILKKLNPSNINETSKTNKPLDKFVRCYSFKDIFDHDIDIGSVIYVEEHKSLFIRTGVQYIGKKWITLRDFHNNL